MKGKIRLGERFSMWIGWKGNKTLMDFLYSFICITHRVLGKLLFRMKLKLVHLHELPYKGPLIIAPNHSSYLDPPFLAALWWPKKLDFFASQHLFQSKILKFIFQRTHVHPLNRGSGMQALRQALKLLSEGKTVVIFPEGTRTRDGSMGTLKKGIALLSEKAQCPVVPVFIKGAYEAWPPGKKLPYLFPKEPVTVYVGKPLSPCPEGAEEYNDWLIQLQSVYKELEEKACRASSA